MLTGMRRISCKIFSKSCSCDSMQTAMYCTPIMNMSGNKSIHPKSITRYSSTEAREREKEHSTPVDTSFKARAKSMWKKYGYIAIGTYLGVYVTTLTSIFFALDFDVFNAATFGLDPVQAVAKVCDIYESATGHNSLPAYFRENPRMGTFAIAWVMTKFTEPVRLGVTLAIVPSIGRWMQVKEAEKHNSQRDNKDDTNKDKN